jgi:hypothetical protein
MDEPIKERAGDAEAADSSASVAEFPDEPFPCPECGQLLAPSCRVCVACRRPIDFAAINRRPAAVLPASPTPAAELPRERVPFPWRIFVVVLSISLILSQIALVLWGEEKGLIAIQGMLVLVGIWVFFDALRRRIPRPLRWGVGTVMLLAVFLPWYLARRSKPEASVPLEAEPGPLLRFILLALLIFFLIGLVINIVQGPPPKVVPAPAPKAHPGSSSSQVTLDFPARHRLVGGGRTRHETYGIFGSVEETSAPSDAWQT